MKIEQIYTGCLAQGAYYIESNGEAVIIDPLRETEPYLRRAANDGAQIKYIFETHFHADFVSGHLDLAAKTGATIVYGPTAKPGFTAHVAEDGEILTVGDISFQVLHTPGHTMESSCFLLKDEKGNNKALFTGDTLFIGDVGRPDLAQKVNASLTEDMLAGLLYDSLHNKILPLEDGIIIYPAHGAGSACGKNMSRETTDTLGHQRAVNYALQPMTREQFIKEVTTGLTPPPGYFPENVLLNLNGYESFDTVIERSKKGLNIADFEKAAQNDEVLLIDTRTPDMFAAGFIPGSVNIGIDGSFAPWAGTLIPDIQQKILLVTEAGREEETITRLARIGYDHCIGYLEGGFNAWKAAGKATDQISCITAVEMAAKTEQAPVLDVRRQSEYESEHLVNAINVPLDYINQHLPELDKERTYYVHCASGYRSMIFCSILKARGYNNMINVNGGFQALKSSGLFEITDYKCPMTML
ncbi:MBL fold metallo-hydrolase [Sediminibacterium ginsengisoli]|uniref:Glyoxylase, beta-lactamase superfamily II n=1 Tax=Sediminibacterium ginsengisoli TaxID=413434 RepID=A0A1T4LD70_9BACT|nr:MBL fold metallo-hydrolase [Sediminibacterium ginsengisoli]SJZ52689.1 Glyoxylase, beta-lactamase superfamily II [Sediminibacterium ginsengisoli]